MDFWIPLLGGALGAALINGILALYKLRRDREVEHDQWLRNEKRDVYQEYLKSGNYLSRFVSLVPERWHLMKDDMKMHVKILLSDDIDFFVPKHLDAPLRAFGAAVTNAFAYEERTTEGLTREQAREDFEEAYQILRKAMRKDLGIKD
ncbi:hypothetical protein [Arthrobacter sp. B2a2-09]|uniref:hypothetical protein n=1 Tax=Arthrobacter sp. B2a2-09 TaxID=2952822 RepID=UPI0022CD7990|nr:hypothetical protein [Arthrobacter sp. B2a2-09]MCZ9882021.1 hypothetical protein [Arthrobacter sp. B2a2-09]